MAATDDDSDVVVNSEGIEAVEPSPFQVGAQNIYFTHGLDSLSQADPSDIQKIAASQIELLNSYYNTSLYQAKLSFRWALIAAGVGLAFLLSSLAFTLTAQSPLTSTIAAIGGVVAEFVSGVNFWLYGKTLRQLNHFHERLDQLQRFLLANSICESLEREIKQKARYNLVATIANFTTDLWGESVNSRDRTEMPSSSLNQTAPLRGSAG